MTEVATKTRKRRVQQPRKSARGGVKHPNASAWFKAKWQDPEWRAWILERQREGVARANAKRPVQTRMGVPDGYTKETAAPLWERATELARKFIKMMEETGQVDEKVVPGSDEAMAKAALAEAFKMAVSPLTDAKVKGGYIRTVLEFTKSKPESKSKLTINKAEEWLADLASDMKDKQSDAAVTE